MTEIKKMTPKEFREQGYLRELNRRFLHPLGLALEVVAPTDGETFEEHFGSVWDYRDDPEGMAFDDSMVATEKAIEDAARIEAERASKEGPRQALFGWVIQPVPEKKSSPEDKVSSTADTADLP